MKNHPLISFSSAVFVEGFDGGEEHQHQAPKKVFHYSIPAAPVTVLPEYFRRSCQIGGLLVASRPCSF